MYKSRCVIKSPRYGPSPKKVCKPTRELAPVANVRIAEKRVINSRSTAVSISMRRTLSTACSAPAANPKTVLVGIVITFRSGISAIVSRMNRLSSNTRKYTFSRPTISIARRVAEYARTVEPCSANLTKRMRRTCRRSAECVDPKIFLPRVRIAQSGTPIQRSARCKVEMPAGRSIL